MNKVAPLAKRILSAILCVTLVAAVLLAAMPIQSQAQNYGQYKDVAKVKDQGSCPSMQGMSVCGNYIYACKIDGNTDASAVVARVNNNASSSSYGTVEFLTNKSTSTKFFSDFGHGNDIEVEDINGTLNLFVPTSTKGSGSLVRYTISGTTATKLGNYTMTCDGAQISGGAIRVTHFDSENITLLFKSGKICYTGTLPISQTSGTLEMTKLCTLNYDTAYVNGTAKDTSQYSLQGMGYYDQKLYLPLSGHTVSGHENISIILVYDLEGASGTIYPDPDITFCMTSSAYSAYFEVESCEISPKDGRLYFSANRRVSSSDTNHDGVSYITNWTYDPSTREGGAQNYRWELQNDELVSTTNGGNVFNGIYQMEGSIDNGTITNGRFVLSKPVVLEHDQPWILEWKSSGACSTALLFATEAESKRTDKPYVFRRTGSSIIAIGAHDGTNYNNYGLDLADYGVDGSASHVYRMTNKIASDGTNMVYLSVDDKELGALNKHYIASTYQNSTSNWISGKDLSFSYLGTLSHKISNCKIDYIQVWNGGLGTADDEPNNYRWESGMTNVTTYGLTENIATLVSGSTTGITYTDCRYDLEQDIVLMHDQPWVIEWDDSGSWSTGLLLAADHLSNTRFAPYLFRGGSIIALGYYDGSKHTQWGVKLADHGISLSDPHTYAVKNIIAEDGTNMIWLYVDGNKIAPMNTVCSGGTASSSTSNQLAGKDFVFSHIGTFQHDLTGKMDHLQVWEAGIPAEHQSGNYRWETKNNQFTNVTGSPYQTNKASYIKGSCASGVYTDTQYMLDKPIMLRHDQPWSLEWQCEGAWTGGGLLLSTNRSANTKNNMYIFRNSKVISIGQYTGSQHEQWGIRPGDYGIDHSQLHTYKLTNQINTDGSNMIYLYVDGQKLGALNNVCISGNPNGSTSNYLSGKDFMFSYVGSDEYPIRTTTMNYIQVNEGCSHNFSSWSVIEASTCTNTGTKSSVCTLCGITQTETTPSLGHNYLASVTAPDCTNHGYTTYTCNRCNDYYVDNYTDTIEHRYTATVVAPTCNSTGYTNYTCNLCGDSYNDQFVDVTGHNYKATVIDPNCTNPGYTSYTCTDCGDSYTGNHQAATGHSYQTTTTPATCTATGSITTVCSGCGDRQVETIPALGHSYTSTTVDPTCNNAGYTQYTCTVCGYTYKSNHVSALGHSYIPIVTAPSCTIDGYTTYTCFECGNTYTDSPTAATGHSFANGICGNCGEADPNYSPVVVIPTLTLKAPTLEFKDMITVNAMFEASNIEDVVEMGMITYTEKVDEWSVETANHVIPGTKYDESTGRYIAVSQGIHAKYLGDTVYLACYAKLTDGSYVYTKLASYSPVQYAASKLKGTDVELKQLVVAMLNYGAAAQTHFNHNVENLANATLTAEQIALPEAYRADMVSTVASPNTDKQGAFANNKGFSKRYPSISFEGAFCINYFFTPAYAPVGQITLYYWNAADYEAADVLSISNASGSIVMELQANGEYRADIAGIAAKALSEGVYVAATYTDGVSIWTSGVLGYSIGAYCASQSTKGGTIADLAMATAVYGYQAKQYFG